MSSGAARKAYPAADVDKGGTGAAFIALRNRDAFDRGAVEALRQAADMMRSARDGETPGPNWIDRMADDWKEGQ